MATTINGNRQFAAKFLAIRFGLVGIVEGNIENPTFATKGQAVVEGGIVGNPIHFFGIAHFVLADMGRAINILIAAPNETRVVFWVEVA